MTDESDDDTADDSTDESEISDFEELQQVTDRLDDDNVASVPFHGDPDDYPRIKVMAIDVNHHGEVHATIEEHDKELEVRKGTTVFDFDAGLISVTTESHHDSLTVSMDHVVGWYTPYNSWH